MAEVEFNGIREGVGEPMALGGLLSFLGGVTQVATAVKGISTLLGPGAPPAPTTTTAIVGPVSPGPITTTGRAPVGWPQWIVRILITYGPSIAEAIWAEYQKRRRAGQSHQVAQVAAASAVPGAIHVARGRRRMNPTNVRALRRAIRRVRSFRRISGKVNRLLPRRPARSRVIYRRGRRGDLSPFFVEDFADIHDEAEDLGYDPGSFHEADDQE